MSVLQKPFFPALAMRTIRTVLGTKNVKDNAVLTVTLINNH